MTFNKLHDGLRKKCKCLELGPAIENTTDVFFRLIKNNPPDDSDFRSFKELNEPRKSNECDYLCKYRSISMDKITEANEEEIKQKWAERALAKPQKGTRYLKFRVRAGCGLVWATPTKGNKHHHTLLRSDTFTVSELEHVETGDL